MLVDAAFSFVMIERANTSSHNKLHQNFMGQFTPGDSHKCMHHPEIVVGARQEIVIAGSWKE
jgi:hypothetical protein